MRQGPIEKAYTRNQEEIEWKAKIQRKREVANYIMSKIIRQFQLYQQNDIELEFDPWPMFEEQYRQFYDEEKEKKERRDRRMRLTFELSQKCQMRYYRYVETGGLRKTEEEEEEKEEKGKENQKDDKVCEQEVLEMNEEKQNEAQILRIQKIKNVQSAPIAQQISHIYSKQEQSKNKSFSALQKTKQLQKTQEIYQQSQGLQKIQQPKIQQDEDEEEAVISATESGTKPKNKKKNRTRAQKKARIQARNNSNAEALARVNQQQAELLMILQFQERQGIDRGSLRNQFIEPTKQEIQKLTEGNYTSVMKAHVLNKFTAILMGKLGLKLQDWSMSMSDAGSNRQKIQESKESFVRQLLCPVSFLLKKSQLSGRKYSKQLTESTQDWVMKQLDRIVNGFIANLGTEQYQTEEDYEEQKQEVREEQIQKGNQMEKKEIILKTDKKVQQKPETTKIYAEVQKTKDENNGKIVKLKIRFQS